MRKCYIGLLLVCVVVISATFVGCSEQGSDESLPTVTESTMENETVSEGLSDDLNSLMFELNGILYEFQDPLMKLLDNGWVIDDTWQRRIYWQEYERLEDVMLEALSRAPAPLYLLYEGQRIRVEAFNSTEYEIPLLGSTIEAIFSSRNYSQMVFPGGISVGSTYEEVIAAHGEPTERTIISDSERLSYFLDGFYISFVVERETGMVFLLIMEAER